MGKKQKNLPVRLRTFKLSEKPAYVKSYVVYKGEHDKELYYAPMILDTRKIKHSIFQNADHIVINGKRYSFDKFCKKCSSRLVCLIPGTDKRDEYECDPKKLKYKLTPFNGKPEEIIDLIHLAYVLQVNTKKIMFFVNDKKSHWEEKEFEQKNGKIRKIFIPEHGLKKIQRRINEHLLSPVLEQLPNYVTGFIKHRNIVTNALMHTNKKIVINIDISDFFYSIPYPRVFKQFFTRMGFNKKVSYLLTKLCVYNDVKNGKTLIPPGAPTSPAISNLICWQLDQQMEKMAKSLGLTFSRYADDITLSTNNEVNPVKIVEYARNICEHNGFIVNEDKVRIMRSGRRQEVTGLIVNKKPNIKKEYYRRLRAEVHHAKEKNFFQLMKIRGKLAFLGMVNKARFEKLTKQLAAILGA